MRDIVLAGMATVLVALTAAVSFTAADPTVKAIEKIEAQADHNAAQGQLLDSWADQLEG